MTYWEAFVRWLWKKRDEVSRRFPFMPARRAMECCPVCNARMFEFVGVVEEQNWGIGGYDPPAKDAVWLVCFHNAAHAKYAEEHDCMYGEELE